MPLPAWHPAPAEAGASARLQGEYGRKQRDAQSESDALRQPGRMTPEGGADAGRALISILPLNANWQRAGQTTPKRYPITAGRGPRLPLPAWRPAPAAAGTFARLQMQYLKAELAAASPASQTYHNSLLPTRVCGDWGRGSRLPLPAWRPALAAAGTIARLQMQFLKAVLAAASAACQIHHHS